MSLLASSLKVFKLFYNKLFKKDVAFFKRKNRVTKIYTCKTDWSAKSSNDKPIICPSVKYLVFQPGSTFNLTCEMNSSKSGGNVITWKSPESVNPPGVKTSVSRTRWSVAENGFTVATLTVSDATYADTGFYTCQSTENDRLFQEQYVYIQGIHCT